MRKYVFVPAVVIAGAAGLFLRLAELGAAFDDDFLPLAGAWQSIALIILSAAVAVLCAVFAAYLSRRFVPVGNYSDAFSPVLRTPYLALGLIAACAVVVGAVLLIVGGSADTLILIMAVLAVLTGIAFAVTTVSAYKGADTGALRLLSVIPPLFMCLWLICVYRDHSADPVLLRYAYLALAVACAALASYHNAGYAYGKRTVFMTVLTGALTVFFGMTALADYIRTSDVPHMLLMSGTVLFQIISTSNFCFRLSPRE